MNKIDSGINLPAKEIFAYLTMKGMNPSSASSIARSCVAEGKTLLDLFQMTPEELLKIPYIGPRTVKILKKRTFENLP